MVSPAVPAQVPKPLCECLRVVAVGEEVAGDVFDGHRCSSQCDREHVLVVIVGDAGEICT
jgi:hypothetical protein